LFQLSRAGKAVTPTFPTHSPIIHHFENSNSGKRKYTSTVRNLRNIPPSCKAVTHLTSSNIGKAMGEYCCSDVNCQANNFTIHEITQLRASYNSLSNEEKKSQFLLELFKSFHTTDPTIKLYIIGGKSFAIVVLNKSVCPKRFTLLYGISFLKMKVATLHATNSALSNPLLPTSNTLTPTSTTFSVAEILQDYFDSSTTTAKVNNQIVRFLHGFGTRKQFWQFFIAEQQKEPG